MASMHPGIHIETVDKHDQANNDQAIIHQRLCPIFKTTAKNPRKYNKQDPYKSYSQNRKQSNDQYFFIHDSSNTYPVIF
jgi:hypothetical protein